MKSKNLVISTGFAMFSMFFGSGNLIFPLAVGKESGEHFILGALGILLTGVFVPFLGVFAMHLYKGNTEDFFGSMGQKIAKFWFPLIALSLMGPFGVLARCITVAHGSFRLVFPFVDLLPFSIAMCAILFLVSINKSRIIPWIGTFLTPHLLSSLATIALCAYWLEVTPEKSELGSLNALSLGIFQGYQTMDLLAAFFFSKFIIQQLNEHPCDSKSQMKIFLKSSLLGASLLTTVYVALVYTGAMYKDFLMSVPPQEMLGVIAQQALGVYSTPVVCIAVVLACFTTAVVLTSLFADFLHTEVSQNKLSLKASVVVTLLIALFVSTLEFAGIASFLAPILETLYPALIVMTLLNIAHRIWGFKNHRWPVALTFIAKLCTI